MKWLVCSFALVCLGASGSAQIVGGRTMQWHQYHGAAVGDFLGNTVSGAGDVNRDGYDDFVVGVQNDDSAGRSNAGSARVHSGKDGALIWRFDGPEAEAIFGHAIDAAGDVNRDGYADIIVGANYNNPAYLTKAGSAFVYSGRDGSLLWRFVGVPGEVFGYAVAGGGDINRDGYDDVMVGAYLAAPGGRSKAGSIHVYSGKDGVELWQFDGAAAGDMLGFTLDGIGDCNGDGFADLVAGIPFSDPGGRSDAGAVLVYSGKDGSTLRRYDGDTAGDNFGYCVAGAGDVDGDGVGDLVVAAHHAAPGGRTRAGTVLVYSGRNWRKLWQFSGVTAGDEMGYAVDGAGDFNADGYADLLITSWLARPDRIWAAGTVYVFSGRDGKVLAEFHGSASNFRLGTCLAAAGDTNGDGFDDIIVGARHARPGGRNEAGSAFVWGHDPFLVPSARRISTSTGGLIAYQLRFPLAHAGERYILLMSSSGTGPFDLLGVQVPLTFDPLVYLTFFGDIGAGLAQFEFHGTLDGNARATAFLGLPPTQFWFLRGMKLDLAAISYPSGFLPRSCSAAVPLQFLR